MHVVHTLTEQLYLPSLKINVISSNQHFEEGRVRNFIPYMAYVIKCDFFVFAIKKSNNCLPFASKASGVFRLGKWALKCRISTESRGKCVETVWEP